MSSTNHRTDGPAASPPAVLSPKDQQRALDDILDEALEELEDENTRRNGQESNVLHREPSPNVENQADTAAPVPLAEASNVMTDTITEKYIPNETSASDTSAVATDKHATKQSPQAQPNEDSLHMLDDFMKQMLLHDGEENMEDAEKEATAMLNSFMNQLQTELASELAHPEPNSAAAPPETTEKKKKPNPKENSTRKKTKSKDPPKRVVAGPPPPPPAPPPPEPTVDSTIDSLLESLHQPLPHGNHDNDDMLEEMAREFEKILLQQDHASSNDNNASDALVNGMMQQLLSKELMYEPMKQVCEKFPTWLQSNKDQLSKEEYERRGKQLECFQQLVVIYETEPNNTEKLMTLMERVQEYGQPPAEIVQDLAPGLVLDEEGMPQVMPGATDQDCCIM